MKKSISAIFYMNVRLILAFPLIDDLDRILAEDLVLNQILYLRKILNADIS